MAQYTFTGYDASAHMTEETHDASTAGPEGHRPVHLDVLDRRLRAAPRLHLRHPVVRRGPHSPTGAPPAQILLDALGATAGKLLLLVVIGAQLFCGMASVTANSRMIYAFSRDGALPFSHVWHTVSPRTRTPVAAVWLAALGALVLGPAVPDQRHRVRGRDVRSPSSASTSRTSSRRCCGCARATTSSAGRGTWAAGRARSASSRWRGSA